MHNEVIIKRYQEDDHEEVRSIYSSGRIVANTKNGILLGLQSPKVIGFLTAMFAIGSIHSMFSGISLLLLSLAVHSLIIYLCYALNVRCVVISTFEMTSRECLHIATWNVKIAGIT